MMTEDEAKTKWCPFVRLAAPVDSEAAGTAGNRYGPLEAEWVSRCIGSKCMTWRWLPLMADEAFKNAIIKAADDIGDKSENRMKATKHVTANRGAYGLPKVPFEGFCGLAGTP